MTKLKITAKELRSIGFPESPVIPVAMHTISKYYKFNEKETIIALLKAVLETPEKFIEDEQLGMIAAKLIPPEIIENKEISLKEAAVPFNTFGMEQIEEGAIQQMYTAARLPVSVACALLPDAHQGKDMVCPLEVYWQPVMP